VAHDQRLRQETSSLSYIQRPCFKKQTETKNQNPPTKPEKLLRGEETYRQFVGILSGECYFKKQKQNPK
jgi:hypothetical protein